MKIPFGAEQKRSQKYLAKTRCCQRAVSHSTENLYFQYKTELSFLFQKRMDNSAKHDRKIFLSRKSSKRPQMGRWSKWVNSERHIIFSDKNFIILPSRCFYSLNKHLNFLLKNIKENVRNSAGKFVITILVEIIFGSWTLFSFIKIET